ncbi:MAG: hypothetical protein JWQ50_6725 [Caballeronia mineralivorans]|jgi:hypothetical protein|nr:hypothetical protein [Caballeronia mineralivorans]MEA3101978.1 hypothetical protein [Caballeronia mineralivorans]
MTYAEVIHSFVRDMPKRVDASTQRIAPLLPRRPGSATMPLVTTEQRGDA